MSRILFAAREDASDLRDRVAALVAIEGTVETDLSALPTADEEVVALVVLSPLALSDPAIQAFAGEIRRRGFPLIPIVEDLSTYDFKSVPSPEIRALNARAWLPGEGKAILDAVRGHLGKAAFPRKKKVFISYHRATSESAARRIRDHLRGHDYEPFLDTLDVEGGAVVQEQVMDAIRDRDFVLLIDSDGAQSSGWVRAEIVEALNQRIPLRAITDGASRPHPLLSDVERLTWNPRDRRMLGRIRDLVSRGIGASTSFDDRCRRVLQGIVDARGLKLDDRGRRRLLLTDGAHQVLVEYEAARPSLERLHRLFKGHLAEGAPALLVSGDQPLAEPTTEAIDWARGGAPLTVVTLPDLASALDHVFP